MISLKSVSQDVPRVTSDTLLENPHAYLKAATALNTRKAYQSDIQHFINAGGLLPASTEGILHYLHQFASQLNARTLQRRLTALKQWHLRISRSYRAPLGPQNRYRYLSCPRQTRCESTSPFTRPLDTTSAIFTSQRQARPWTRQCTVANWFFWRFSPQRIGGNPMGACKLCQPRRRNSHPSI